MELFKTIFKILVSLILGVGVWYGIGVLLSGELNPILWDGIGKVLAILFTIGTSRTFYDMMEDK
jgi:hypothetical protein